MGVFYGEYCKSTKFRVLLNFANSAARQQLSRVISGKSPISPKNVQKVPFDTSKIKLIYSTHFSCHKTVLFPIVLYVPPDVNPRRSFRSAQHKQGLFPTGSDLTHKAASGI